MAKHARQSPNTHANHHDGSGRADYLGLYLLRYLAQWGTTTRPAPIVGMTKRAKKATTPGVATVRLQLRPVTSHTSAAALARLLATGQNRERRAG